MREQHLGTFRTTPGSENEWGRAKCEMEMSEKIYVGWVRVLLDPVFSFHINSVSEGWTRFGPHLWLPLFPIQWTYILVLILIHSLIPRTIHLPSFFSIHLSILERMMIYSLHLSPSLSPSSKSCRAKSPWLSVSFTTRWASRFRIFRCGFKRSREYQARISIKERR